MPSYVRAIGLASTISAFGDMKSRYSGNPTWVVGTPVEYGLYLELGTRNHPPYSWLEPAVDEVVNNEGDRIAEESDNVYELVKNVALAIERRAAENTSGDDERPYVRTGNLHASITAVEM